MDTEDGMETVCMCPETGSYETEGGRRHRGVAKVTGTPDPDVCENNLRNNVYEIIYVQGWCRRECIGEPRSGVSLTIISELLFLANMTA